MEALWWAMENILQHSICQNFETDCKNLISMIKESHAWSNSTTELEAIKTLLIYFPHFKISHILTPQNGVADSLARTAKSFYREWPCSFTCRTTCDWNHVCLCVAWPAICDLRLNMWSATKIMFVTCRAISRATLKRTTIFDLRPYATATITTCDLRLSQVCMIGKRIWPFCYVCYSVSVWLSKPAQFWIIE